MKPSRTSRLLCKVVGAACLVLAVWQLLWISHAWQEAHHMGSPIRRFTRHDLEALRGRPDYVLAVESYDTGMALIRTLEDTFQFLYLSSALLIVIGATLFYVSAQIPSPQAPDDGPAT